MGSGGHDFDYDLDGSDGSDHDGTLGPLLAVFVVACLFQAVSAVGFSQLAARTHRLFQRLFKTAEAQKLRDLKAEILSLKNDISRTSAQDEFAKWAKMRRQYDKLLSNFEQAAKERASKKSSFEFMMSWGLWILFWVLQILFIIVWRKEAMFYIPRDWVGPFSSWLRFPFAPAGSVSVLYWFYACRSVFGRAMKYIAPSPASASASVPTSASAPASE